MGELILLGMLGALGAWLMSSLLPISLALIVGVAAISTFPILRRRLTAGDHFLYVSATWIALGIVFILLMHFVGREPFEWLIEWY